jgi:rRNA maturation RNase YbeY
VFSFSNTTHARIPALPFERIARYILSNRYELSVACVGDKKSRDLNRTYRKRRYTPNVLSFPLSQHAGEIVINPRVAKREALRYGITYPKRLALLFIHGCLHLKGMRHGATMEDTTRRVLRRFSLM